MCFVAIFSHANLPVTHACILHALVICMKFETKVADLKLLVYMFESCHPGNDLVSENYARKVVVSCFSGYSGAARVQFGFSINRTRVCCSCSITNK